MDNITNTLSNEEHIILIVFHLAIFSLQKMLSHLHSAKVAFLVLLIWLISAFKQVKGYYSFPALRGRFISPNAQTQWKYPLKTFPCITADW